MLYWWIWINIGLFHVHDDIKHFCTLKRWQCLAGILLCQYICPHTTFPGSLSLSICVKQSIIKSQRPGYDELLVFLSPLASIPWSQKRQCHLVLMSQTNESKHPMRITLHPLRITLPPLENYTPPHENYTPILGTPAAEHTCTYTNHIGTLPTHWMPYWDPPPAAEHTYTIHIGNLPPPIEWVVLAQCSAKKLRTYIVELRHAGLLVGTKQALFSVIQM